MLLSKLIDHHGLQAHHKGERCTVPQSKLLRNPPQSQRRALVHQKTSVEHRSFALPSHTRDLPFLKGERARSNSHAQITLAKIKCCCHNEGSTRETETSMVPGDPNFSIARVKGMVVQSLLSINLPINSNSFEIFFCASDSSVTITASQ